MTHTYIHTFKEWICPRFHTKKKKELEMRTMIMIKSNLLDRELFCFHFEMSYIFR